MPQNRDEGAHPRVRFLGEDGNAFAIIARCRAAARAAGWTEGEVKLFTTRATSTRSYDELLGFVMDLFEIE